MSARTPKPGGGKRTVNWSIAWTEAEHDFLRQEAQRAGLPIARLLRAALAAKFSREGSTSPFAASPADGSSPPR